MAFSKVILLLIVPILFVACFNNQTEEKKAVAIQEPVVKEFFFEPSIQNITEVNWFVDLVDLKNDTVTLSRKLDGNSGIRFRRNNQIETFGKYKILHQSNWNYESKILKIKLFAKEAPKLNTSYVQLTMNKDFEVVLLSNMQMQLVTRSTRTEEIITTVLIE